jgi:hypothetical protein
MQSENDLGLSNLSDLFNEISHSFEKEEGLALHFDVHEYRPFVVVLGIEVYDRFVVVPVDDLYLRLGKHFLFFFDD